MPSMITPFTRAYDALLIIGRGVSPSGAGGPGSLQPSTELAPRRIQHQSTSRCALCGSRVGLVDRPFLRFGIVGEISGKESVSTGACELEILGLVGDSHAAFAELFEGFMVENNVPIIGGLHGRV